MEWKADEKLMFDLAGNALGTKHLPGIGMPSGGGLPNAGFSVWPFIFFRLLSSNPLFSMLLVALCNVLAIFIFIRCIKLAFKKDTDLYLTGILSFGVSLLPVIFSRKIWAQDLMPLFIALIWYSYLLTNKNIVYAFFVGLAGALSGQLHLSGFYYTAGLFIAIFYFKKFNLKQWISMLIGFIVGLVPSIGWINAVLHNQGSVASVSNLLKFEFWLHALTDPPGVNARYSLGEKTFNFLQFGYSWVPVLIALLIGIIVLLGLAKFFIRRHYQAFLTQKELLFTLIAFVLIPGLLMTISGIPVRSHYLIGASPFLCILFVILVNTLGFKYVKSYIALQALFTLLFLSYVHTRQDVGGDYGATYHYQIEENK